MASLPSVDSSQQRAKWYCMKERKWEKRIERFEETKCQMEKYETK
jgi:hypothetical protein